MWTLIYHWFGLKYVKCHECETLKLLLDQEKVLSKRLLEQLVKEPEVKPETPVVFEPLKPRRNLQDMKKHLEMQDKIKAEQLANDRKVLELEKELKLNEA